ncbi:MAG: hypothetical protein Q6L58_06945 [Thermostichales cyanobacterium BF3_bins_165]
MRRANLCQCDVYDERRGKVIAVSLPNLQILSTVGIGPDTVAIAPNVSLGW